MKRAIIVGATSGIGQEIAKVLLAQGWKIGIAGRRKELLTAFQERNPEQIATQALDVTQKIGCCPGLLGNKTIPEYLYRFA